MKPLVALTDLTPDPENANEGTLRGEQLLDKSLSECGAGRSIVVDRNGVVIGGNKTLQMAVESGLGMRLVPSDGSKLVVVVRADLDLANDPQARILAYFDNRASEVGLKWKSEQLEADIASGLDLDGLFTARERKAMLAALEQDTQKPPKPPPKSMLSFDTPKQAAQWRKAVQAIEALDGETFAEKLDCWVTDQMGKL